MRRLLLTAILLIFVSPVFASDLTDRISDKLLDKKWDEALSVVDNVQVRTSEQKTARYKLRQIVKSISQLYIDYDKFQKLAAEDKGDALEFYKSTYKYEFIALHKRLPFKKELVADINNLRDLSEAKADNLIICISKEKKIAEDQRHAEEKRKQEIEAENRQNIDKQTLPNNLAAASSNLPMEKRSYRYTNEFAQAENEARASGKYQEMAVRCNLCIRISNRKANLNTMKEDDRYAQKYGVINLSRKASHIEAVQYDDSEIRDGKIAYKEVSGKKFNTTSCKSITEDFCYDLETDYLEKLTIELMGKTKTKNSPHN